MPKREPFPSIDAAPEGHEEEARPMISGGERIGVQEAFFSKYAERLSSIDPKMRTVDVQVEKFYPPENLEIPPTCNLIQVIAPSTRGALLRIEVARPRDLTEDDIRMIFGDVYLHAAHIHVSNIHGPHSILRRQKLSSALDGLVRERRLGLIKRELANAIGDHGLRALCEQVIEAYPDKVLVPPQNPHPLDAVREGYELFESLHETLSRPTTGIAEVTHRMHRLAMLWSKLALPERSRVLRELLTTIP